jgi:hypothetical protein
MIASRLRRDRAFLVTLMGKIGPDALLENLSGEIQATNWHVPALAIKLLNISSLEDVRIRVKPKSLWGNKRIAIEWILRGMSSSPLDIFMMQDPDVPLEIAQHLSPWEFSVYMRACAET